MTLEEIYKKTNTPYPFERDFSIQTLCDDTRRLQGGDIFIDWTNQFGKAALEKGAVAVIDTNNTEKQNIYKIIDTFFQPKPKNIVAVTGTNGKTSVTHFTQQLLNRMGVKSAALGTLGVVPKNNTIPYTSELTTPPIGELHEALQKLGQQNYEAVAMEASSHGLKQGRLHEIDFCGVALTNIEHDHLDYHGTWEDYRDAKLSLFKDWPKATSVVAAGVSHLVPHATWVYGNGDYDLGVREVQFLPNGFDFELIGYGRHRLSVIGEFQLHNILCAMGLILTMGYDVEDILPHLSLLQPVPGRIEYVGEHNGANIYVDFAHTPDSVETILKTLRKHTEKELHIVFGCGGDRDASKREPMGHIANQYADKIYITDDNPRNEDPELIRKSILKACPKGIDAGERQHAMAHALQQLKPGDTLVVAGRGDEQYQKINGQNIPFHDATVLKKLLETA